MLEIFLKKKITKTLPNRPKILIGESRKIIIYQGALNLGRGLEYAVSAMQYLDNHLLLIVGGGDIEQQLKQQSIALQLSKKVIFTGRLPFNELAKYTKFADLGISIEENYSLNYYYALPNKLFDYIRAEIPILASELPEIKKIVAEYKIGDFIENHDPKHIAKKIEQIFAKKEQYQTWKSNLKIASAALSWENEEKALFSFFC